MGHRPSCVPVVLRYYDIILFSHLAITVHAASHHIHHLALSSTYSHPPLTAWPSAVAAGSPSRQPCPPSQA
eukprot:3470927-Prymnesium_polylepis.1